MRSPSHQSPDTAARPVLRASVVYRSLPGSLRYEVTVRGAAPFGIPDIAYFLEVSGDVVPPAVDRFDFVVLSLIFFAMHQGADLHVEGRLSRRLLVDMEEFQRAWTTWLPHRYQRIRVSCDAGASPPPAPAGQRAVLAFSGGVDSACVMLDQIENRGERDHYELVTAVLILGFDVALEEHAGLDAAHEAARAMTGAAGVPLSVVRTNLRARLSYEWPDEFAAAVAACLSVFAPVADAGLLASDADYRHIVLPCGSNMITNPMMSGDAFRIVTAASALGRTERVARVASHPAVADQIRVCWEGPSHGWNCGVCEKCLRTKLNFIAAGAPVPASLAPAPAVREIVGLVAKEKSKILFLKEIAEAARRGSMPRSMRIALCVTILKNRLLLPWRRWRRVLRAAARKLRGLPPRRR